MLKIFCAEIFFERQVIEMESKEFLERMRGEYVPKSKTEIFCVSDNCNTDFEIKIAEKIRQMSKYDYELSDIKFSVSANVLPTLPLSDDTEIDVELNQTKAALLIFKRGGNGE